MNSKGKIWQYLITHGNKATNAELANWLRGSKGQLSVGQRLRELRQELQAKGGNLTCKALRPGIYEYEIVTPGQESPDTEQEAAVRHNHLAQEQVINQRAVERQEVFI